MQREQADEAIVRLPGAALSEAIRCSSRLPRYRPVSDRAKRRDQAAKRRLGWVGAGCLCEDIPTPPSEPCMHLSMHTALRSH